MKIDHLEKKKRNDENSATSDILVHIKENGEEALRNIYRQYRTPFLGWAKKHFKTEEATAADVFQDAVTAFYKNVISRKLTQLDVAPKTYLFAIGKNLLLKQHRQNQKIQLVETFDTVDLKTWDLQLPYQEEATTAQEKVMESLEKLGGKCQKLLKFFYFDQLSHRVIADRLSYNSEEVARSMKRKCIKQLTQLIGKDIS